MNNTENLVDARRLGVAVGSTGVVFYLACVSSMKAIIPHHSIAILTSERAHITDPRVRKLADGIIEAQRREIDEIKALMQDLEKKR